MLGGGRESSQFLQMVGACQEVARSHHVDARTKQTGNQCVVDDARGVEHAVGCLTDQRVDVSGSQDSDWSDASECADVLADLVGRIRMHANQFELITVKDGSKRALTDVACHPLHHAILRHRIRHTVSRPAQG